MFLKRPIQWVLDVNLGSQSKFKPTDESKRLDEDMTYFGTDDLFLRQVAQTFPYLRGPVPLLHISNRLRASSDRGTPKRSRTITIFFSWPRRVIQLVSQL